jgi:citrate lyase subunit beta/citryl-CoA lyase
MKPGLPVWRSLLYVPANVEKYVDKAHTRGADCIQLDLEDSVPAAEKDHARRLVEGAAKKVRRAGADVVVRINSPLDKAFKDLDVCIDSNVDGIAVTKTASPSYMQKIDDHISELETRKGLPAGRTRLIAMIETPAAFFEMAAIARSSPRLAAMNIGGEDFALETGMEPLEETLLMPKQQMVFAARAAGLMPLGFIASVAGYGDWPAFRAMVRRSRRFGFMGAGCIHPGQVPIVNEEYTPSPEETAYARRVIEENAKAEAAGRASFAIDGKMIDIPVVVRAQRLLQRVAAIAAREARKNIVR